MIDENFMKNFYFFIKTLIHFYNFYDLVECTFSTIKIYRKSELNRCLISWIIYSSLLFIENDEILSGYFSKNLIYFKTIISVLVQFGKLDLIRFEEKLDLVLNLY
jgi:hypothetical protein